MPSSASTPHRSAPRPTRSDTCATLTRRWRSGAIHWSFTGRRRVRKLRFRAAAAGPGGGPPLQAARRRQQHAASVRQRGVHEPLRQDQEECQGSGPPGSSTRPCAARRPSVSGQTSSGPRSWTSMASPSSIPPRRAPTACNLPLAGHRRTGSPHPAASAPARTVAARSPGPVRGGAPTTTYPSSARRSRYSNQRSPDGHEHRMWNRDVVGALNIGCLFLARALELEVGLWRRGTIDATAPAPPHGRGGEPIPSLSWAEVFAYGRVCVPFSLPSTKPS